jgi:hypothetical protein
MEMTLEHDFSSAFALVAGAPNTTENRASMTPVSPGIFVASALCMKVLRMAGRVSMSAFRLF